ADASEKAAPRPSGSGVSVTRLPDGRGSDRNNRARISLSRGRAHGVPSVVGVVGEGTVGGFSGDAMIGEPGGGGAVRPAGGVVIAAGGSAVVMVRAPLGAGLIVGAPGPLAAPISGSIGRGPGGRPGLPSGVG